MAINAYTGLMGSGKSYEVVSSVIVPAILSGRRVVTNIDGINPDAIRNYCIVHRKAQLDTLGEVIRVTNADVTRAAFFPDETRPDAESVVRAGDLVAIDEAWNFWSTSNKIAPEHQRFFRMHRHYVHPVTGVACDVALMIQSIADLHRQLRAVVELTFRTKKLKELGAARFYRVEMYETYKTTKSSLLDTFNKAYDKEIFPLYSSYAGGKGQENAIDKRQNILANKRLWCMAALCLAAAGISVRLIWGFFHPSKPDAPVSAESSGSGEQLAAPSPGNATNAPRESAYSTRWRVVGNYSIDDSRWIVVADTSGRLRIESPSMFGGSGLTTIGQIDGQRTTRWTGRLSGTGSAE